MAFNAKNPKGVHLPDLLTIIGIDVLGDEYRPESMEQILSQSKEDAQFNESMMFLLNSISNLIDSGDLEAFYSYDGTEGGAINEKGNQYLREFTHSFEGQFKDFEFSSEGIRFKGNLIISYTQQECVENCDKNE